MMMLLVPLPDHEDIYLLNIPEYQRPYGWSYKYVNVNLIIFIV